MRLPKTTLSLVLFVFCAFSCLAQGTVFTYQGRLNQLGNPANGTYDFQFALYDTNGNRIGQFVTNSTVPVNGGLFTVPLDFGSVFTGSNYWLQIATRTNGATSFTTLSPRQPLTPTPYAIMANSASNLLGRLPTSQLAGTVSVSNLPANYTNILTLSNLPAQFATNVLNAGVTNDGVTDVTAKLQALLNQGGTFYFPAGRYLAQELYITNNTTLIGNGATLVYANNAGNSNIFVCCRLNTNISILGLAFDGGDYPLTVGSRTYTTYAGVQHFADPFQFQFWNPTGLRHGLQFNTEAGGLITGITISGFSGIGLLPVSMTGIGGGATKKTIVTGVNCYSNFVGFFSSGSIGAFIGPNYLPNWITNYVPGGQDPEFMFYSGLNLCGNTIGLCASAGNCTYVNSAFNGNYIGQYDDAGNNEQHGSINSCEYTHNNTLGLWICSSVNGEQIINCQFRDNGGSISLLGCRGITVDNCTLLPLVVTNMSSTGENFFRNNTYGGTWTNQVFQTDGKLTYFGNCSYDTPGDNDGQLLTTLGAQTGPGLTTNVQTTFNNGTQTSTLHFTNGILSSITQP